MSNRLLDRLRTASNQPDTVPPGWRTSRQWAEAWKIPHSSASKYLRDGEEQGLIEARRFRIVTGRGVYPVPHYREKRGGRS